MTNLILAITTAYIATGHLNAAGHKPIPGISIAVPRSIPLGSQVTINGHTYIADDRTALKYDGRFDIFMDSRKAAIQWGKQTLRITVITK